MNVATASPGRRRAATLRRAGWLAVASLVGLALAGPGAGIASAKPDMVTLCHAAGQDGTTQFVTLEIPYQAAYGQGGHFNENGTPQAGHEDDYLGPCTTTTTTSSSTTSTTTTGTTTTESCNTVVYTYSVTPGRHDYPLLTVTVTAPGGVPEGCMRSWSLNSYTTEGPTWETSGTQALFDHDSITLDFENASGMLTVAAPPCYGQTDFYNGTTRFDGADGPLPHYPDSVVPNPGLIAYSNGGTACTTTTTSTTTSGTTTGTTTTDTTTTGTTTTDTTTTGTTTTDTTTTGTTTTDTTTATTTSQAEGAVLPATGKPAITPPPTDALPTTGTPGSDSWRIALLAISGLLATLLLLTPVVPARTRRR